MTNDPKNVREKLITVRVTEERHAEFKLAAELRGSNMSNLIYQFITETIHEEKKKHPQQFQKLGTPINEVAPEEAGSQVTAHTKKNPTTPNTEDTQHTQQPVENFEQEIEQLIEHPPFHPQQGKLLLPDEEPKTPEEWLAVIRSGRYKVVSHEQFAELLKEKKQQT